MWQRFTERARRVVFFAQEEAGRLGENYVSTEHLLLGMVRENDSVGAKILDKMGTSPGRIRSEIERQVARGDGRLKQDMQLTPRSKKVIDLAYDEARQLQNEYIGTEHLLLGMIREGEGLAGRVLAKLGVELDRTRQEVRIFQGKREDSKQEPPTVGKMSTPDVQDQVIDLQDWVQKDETKWRGRSLVSLFDVSAEQILSVLDLASSLKTLKDQKRFLYFTHPKTLALLFEKPSLRTRVSFEAGMAQMAGHAIYLAPGDVGLGVRESVADVAGGLSRWVDAIAARTFKHETVEELAANATVPVINALSDREHPIQAFADLMTIIEQKGKPGNHLKLAYIGDGNNVLHALLLACAKVGVNLTAACPAGYEPNTAYVAEAQRIGSEEGGTGAKISLVTDPEEAVREADVLYTDVWTSMGQEEEKAERLRIFAPYQVNAELLAHAKPDAIVLHCLPAHREEEITSDVMAAHSKVILDQAENRLHTQKALVLLLLGLS